MRMGWLRTVAMAVLPLLGMTATARADSSFAFDWNAPVECPSSTHVETEIGNLLGAPIRERLSFDLAVGATVRHDERWSVSIDTSSKTSNGQRSFQADTCQALANATALIVALMIDPDAVAAHADKPAPPSAPPPPVLPPAPAPELRASLPRQPLTGFVGLDVSGNLGVLPSPDVAIGAEVGIARPWWRLELQAGYGPRKVRSNTLSNPENAYARFQLLSGVLSGCLRTGSSTLGVGGCADFEMGAVLAEGFETSEKKSRTTLRLGAGAGGMADVRVAQALFVVVHADAIAALLRPRYTFDYAASDVNAAIFRSWPVGFRLSVALEWHF